jgi:hypothetical protein
MGGRYRTEEYRPRTTLGEMAAARGSNANSISIQIEINQKKYWGFLNPSTKYLQHGFPASFELYFWGEYFGTIEYYSEGWVCSKELDMTVIEAVGNYLMAWYE